MARVVGIDIGSSQVRVALLRTGYRRVALERTFEVSLDGPESVADALAACSGPLIQHGESIAVGIEGERSFTHLITMPSTALRRMSEVLPFELEAQVPVDFSELVYDYRLLRRGSPTEPIVALAAAARTEQVRARIGLVARAVGREPERVGSGPLPLANLATLSAELAVPGPIALVDLGARRTEVVLLRDGEPVFARTLSRGVEGVEDPMVAEALAAELRQSFVAWTARGGAAVASVFLIGGGAATPGAQAYLSSALGVPALPLPALALEGLTEEQARDIPRFAKAIALGLGLAGRPRDLDLRRGALTYQRGFGFLKEKLPLLSGLGVAIAISFAFSTWAQLRALSQQRTSLETALESVSKEVLGEKTSDAARAQELLGKKEGGEDTDPMPHADAFDVIVALSKGIPSSVTHDIDEFDLQRGHVRIDGVVGSTADAQTVLGGLKEFRCVKDAKISKITQAVNSDRQKYVLEFDLSCPEDAAQKKKPKKAAASDADLGGAP